MHQHENSPLNNIRKAWPNFYKFLKKEAEKQGIFPFELAEHPKQCIDRYESEYDSDFWRLILNTDWLDDPDEYTNGIYHFAERYNSVVPFNIHDLFLTGNETFTNKYSQTYDVKTGISVESEAYGVDFTTKKRLCDY